MPVRIALHLPQIPSLLVQGTIAILLSLFAAGCVERAESGDIPPHIVIILADDMGFGDPGVYNQESGIPTPNIDRVAAEGMRFTDAHSPSAVCTPTRYGLLTGRYSWRSPLKRGVLNGYSPNLIDTTRVTLPRLLRDAGYVTAGVGKWHLGLGPDEPVDYTRPLRPGPLEVGFDSYFGIPASLDMAPYVYFDGHHVEQIPTDSVAAGAPDYLNGGPYWRAGAAGPDFKHIEVLPRVTERAVSTIDAHGQSADDRPLFLYVALPAPHTPWLPTPEFEGTSAAGVYGDFTVMVDWTVGQILEALDRNQMADNTLFFFTSDNGSYWPADWIPRWNHASNGSWRGMKADIWEAGHRIPLVARWPGRIGHNRSSDETVSLVDLMATAAAAARLPLPDDAAEDSHDLLPVLLETEQSGPIREATIMQSSRGVFAIRKGPWKLVEGLGSGGFTPPRTVEPGPGDPPGQLYNLEDDPAETNNLYLSHPEVVSELQQLLDLIRDQGYSRPGLPNL